MTPSRLPRDFARSAAYPVHAIDMQASRAQVLHFNADDYRRASFLDARALGHREIPGWIVSLEDLQLAAPWDCAPAGPHLLFHLGHVGSTLVSRLLDLLPDVLGLREPLPLLALAHERAHRDFDLWSPLVRRLLARPLDARRTVIVKPTSVVTAIAATLLEPPSVRACLLDVDLATWMASMLRDAGLLRDAIASESVRGIGHAHLPHTASDGERLARIWLHEQRCWNALNAMHGSRLRRVGFDAVLRDPAQAIALLATHYGVSPPPDLDARIADSGLLTRDAKVAGRAFTPHARVRALEDSRSRNAGPITDGLRWAAHALQDAAPGDDSIAMRLQPS